MASNLPKAGFTLVVRDADAAREQSFASENSNTTVARCASDFGECDVVITMLPQGKVVREVLLGMDGIAKALKPGMWTLRSGLPNYLPGIGTILVDTSSSSPYDTQRLAKELEALEITLIDSPITQKHVHDTDLGAATLMVGCNSDEAFQKVLPVLQGMAKYVFHMGKLGSGHAMKTLNNYAMASTVIGLTDALVAGQKFGLDPVQMIDVLNVGTGRSFCTSDTYTQDVLPRAFGSGFQLALLTKDVGIAKELFESVSFSSDMPDLILKYFKNSLRELGRADVDHTEIIKVWEKRAAVELSVGHPDGTTVAAVKE